MPHKEEAGVLPFLLVALCVVTLLPTIATGSTTEIIDSTKYKMRERREPSMAVCLQPLDGGPDVNAKLRLEVVPIGVGSDKVHLAGSVDVPKELLQQESGTSLLRYEFTTIDEEVSLKVTLNNKELPYKPFEDMYSGRYEFSLVKFYIKGRVKVTYDCHNLPTTATATTITTTTTTTTTSPTAEIIDSTKYKMRELKEPSMAVCLQPLDGGPDVDAKLRLEVVPIGVGSDKVHLAGNVDVPKELLQQESGTSLLRYEFTTIDEEVSLTVTMNNKKLPYKPFEDMYSGRYEFHLVKFYIRGRVRVTYDCPLPSTTTITDPPARPTTTTTTVPTPPTPSLLPSPPPEPNTVTTTTTTTFIIKPTPPATNIHQEVPKATPATTSEDLPKDKSWVWCLGAVGSVPTLILLVLAVITVLLVAVLALILYRRRNDRKTDTAAADVNIDPLITAHSPQTNHSSSGQTISNPLYRPPPQ